MKTEPTRWIARAFAVVTLSLSLAANASTELDGVYWEGSGDNATVGVRIHGTPAYRTTVFDNGHRVRVTLDNATLGREAADIPGRGSIRGIFPYMAEDNTGVHIDVLLARPEQVVVTPTEFGLRISPPMSAGGYQAAAASAPAAIVPAAVSQVSSGHISTDEVTYNAAQQVVPDQVMVGQTAVVTPEVVNGTAQQVAYNTYETTTVSADSIPYTNYDSSNYTSDPNVVVTTESNNMATTYSESSVISSDQPYMSQTGSMAGGPLVIQDVQYSALAGGRVQIDLKMNGRPDEPGAFVTNQPARLALDFFNTGNGLAQNSVKVGSGAVESVAAIETQDRTRLVINLVKPVAYKTEIQDDGIIIILESATGEAVSASSVKTRQFASGAERPTSHSITKIDFRRDKSGGGKIIVDLSDPKIGVDVKEQSGEILIDFIDTAIPAELERRLDVVDFATPVQSIDAFAQGQHGRIVVTPIGKYRQLAYQSGNTFTLNVTPISPEEEAEENKDEFGYSGEKLSLNFQKISVRAALQVIADFTGLNFVTSDAVKGSLTLRLQDVPWDQALDIILQTKGLAMRQKGNVIWVAPAQEIAAKERQQLEASKQVAELEPLVSELIQINYAKADDIAELLKSIEPVQAGVETGAFGSVSIDKVETNSNTLLSPRGQVTIDARTNTILVQDTSSKIREVRKLIAKLDKPVRQVLIETRIVEASDDFARVLGARLGYGRVTENARFPGASDSNIGNVYIGGNSQDAHSIRVDNEICVEGDCMNVNLPARGIGAETAGQIGAVIQKYGAGFLHLISLEISALEASGKGKVIASPKIMTANQQEAIIKQGQERVFPPSGFNTKPTRDEAVLLLQVKPQITPDDRVVLDVRIKQDVFVDTSVNIKDKKEVQTQVLLENGETVVIGGIYQETSTEDVNKVPLFGDIPVLGNLFKRKSKESARKELLVFLTPKILDSQLALR